MPSITKAKYASSIVRERLAMRYGRARLATQQAAREAGESLSITRPTPYAGPHHLQKLAAEYRPAAVDGNTIATPLYWWTVAPNYGDLLSPWLLGKMGERPVAYTPTTAPGMMGIGSICGHATPESTVWGSGLMGWENKWRLRQAKRYAAVRGPITRSVLRNLGYDVPRTYGDPALLTPLYFWPEVEQEYEVGLVVRWSESSWHGLPVDSSVKLLNFGSSDVESVTRDLLRCKRVASSSLHGLILADAYGIPTAWLDSDSSAGGSRPGGGDFKFYDYLASVNKIQHPQQLEIAAGTVTAEYLMNSLEFSADGIDYDHRQLLDSCPAIERK